MKTLLPLMILCCSMPVLAQIDYNEINERNSQKINSDYRTKKEKRSRKVQNFLKEVMTVDKVDFPKDRPFSQAEYKQIALLSCARKIVQNYAGGYDAPSVAQKQLLAAMDGSSISQDHQKLDAALNGCRDALSNLYYYKKKAIKKDLYEAAFTPLPASTDAEVKTKMILMDMYNTSIVACKEVEASVEAYAIFGGAVGVQHLRCLMSDGRVRSYIGPTAKIGMGIGASVGVNVCEPQEVFAAKAAGGTLAMLDQDSVGEFHAGVVIVKAIDWDKMAGSFRIGAEYEVGYFKGNLGIRIPKKANRWESFLDRLK